MQNQIQRIYLDKVIIHKWCSFLYSDDESVNCLSKSNVSNSFFQKTEVILLNYKDYFLLIIYFML